MLAGSKASRSILLHVPEQEYVEVAGGYGEGTDYRQIMCFYL